MSKLVNDNEWESYNLKKNLKESLIKRGFEKPSITQQKLLEELKDDDTKSGVLEAPTGTGKTISYLISILLKLDPSVKHTQAVIICHTQLLCIQVFEAIKGVCEDLKVTQTLCLGLATGYEFQPNKHIAIGTLHSFLSNYSEKTSRGQGKQAALNSPSNIQTFIIDEADHFYTNNNDKEDIIKCLKIIPKKCQRLFFTATMDEQTRKGIQKDWLKGVDHFTTSVELVLDYTIHLYYDFSAKVKDDTSVIEKQKLLMIEKIFDLDVYEGGFKSIVFCKERKGVDKVYQKLIDMNFSCSRYHGDMNQDEKKEQYMKFLKGETKVIITTDVMARGIDIITIALSVNYDIPIEKSTDGDLKCSPITYVHRTGRAGRFGRKCVSLTLLSDQEDVKSWKQINEYVQNKYGKIEFIKTEENKLEQQIKNHLGQAKADTLLEEERAEQMLTKFDERQATKFDEKDNKKDNKNEKKSSNNNEKEEKDKKKDESNEEVEKNKKEESDEEDEKDKNKNQKEDDEKKEKKGMIYE